MVHERYTADYSGPRPGGRDEPFSGKLVDGLYGTGSLRSSAGRGSARGPALTGAGYSARSVLYARRPRRWAHKAQAEPAFRRMREPRPAHVADGRARHDGGGWQGALQRLRCGAGKKSHRMTVAADLHNHIVPFFAGSELDRVRPGTSNAMSRRSADARDQDDPKPRQYDASIFELAIRKGWCQ